MIKKLLATTSGVLVSMTITQAAFAEDVLNAGNTSWILTSTPLVLFMTIPGLSLFYGGLVRVKNVLSVLMQCFAITCMVSVLWLVVAWERCLRACLPVPAWDYSAVRVTTKVWQWDHSSACR